MIHTSNDDGKTWKGARHDKVLVEPEPQGCQGSTLVAPRSAIAASTNSSRGSSAAAAAKASKADASGIVFFCNPSSDRREMLTVRRSDDGGHTWSHGFLLEEGASAYSCMGLTHDGCLGVLYERGSQISFARIPSAPDGPLGVFC